MTTYLEYERRLKYILYLIKRKRTGTPKQLARKIGVSERTIKRMISVLRQKGEKIIYSYTYESYKFSEDKL